MAFVKDTVELVKEIRRGRNIRKEELVLSADKGCGKVIVTMSIFDANSNEEKILLLLLTLLALLLKNESPGCMLFNALHLRKYLLKWSRNDH